MGNWRPDFRWTPETEVNEMREKGQQAERYYTEEDVIGSASRYHRPSCHVIRNIPRNNYKLLQNWQVAVALGLTPCGVCKPFYVKPEVKRQQKIGF